MDVRWFTVTVAAGAIVFAAVAFARCRSDDRSGEPPVERIIRVARVIALDDTVDEQADSIAVAHGRIVAVGPWERVAIHAGADTEIVDLRPGIAVPGLVDAHAHLVGQGRISVNLVGTTSVEQIVERVAAEVAQRPAGAWILGRGWDQNDWANTALPDRALLDRIAPDHPVVLTRIDGHAVWANTRALERAGIDRSTTDPDGGRIERRADGEPTGVLVDNAMMAMFATVPAATRTEIREAILAAAAECHRLGLTGIHDAGVTADELAVYRELYRTGELKLRSYAMIGGEGALLDRYVASGPEIGACDGRLTIRCLKLYADGALGSRGAALDAPYADAPSTSGLLTTPPERLDAIVRRAVGAGLQVAVHAIGDRANRLVLDAYEGALRDIGPDDPRLRVEHAQILHVGDIDRLARLRVIASMQPTHLTSDGPWAEARLGPDRMSGAYAWRRILRGGGRIAAGSDFPVERVDPLRGLYAAITRRRTDEPHAGAVYSPDQRMTPEEALRAFTIEAAYAAFQEDRGGSLSPGKWADVTVLPIDPIRDDPERLRTAAVVATIVAGEVVYRKAP